MKLHFLLSGALLFSSASVWSQSIWTPKAKFAAGYDWKSKATHPGGARGATCGFSVDGMGYVFGGFNGASEYSELYEYNPSSNTWTKKASMPIAGMREPVAFTLGSVAYVGLGFRAGSPSALSHFYKYEPSSNTWTAVTNYPSARRAASGFSIDTLGYVLGGVVVGSNPDNAFYSYSATTNSWTKKASLPGLSRNYPTCAVVNGKAYAMGGHATASSVHLKDFYCYDPATNKWDTLANFPGAARSTASAIVIGSVIYIGGGHGNSTFYSDCYAYNTTTKVWTKALSFPSDKAYGNAFFSINQKGYLSTGAKGSVLTDSTFEFSPGASRGAACGFSMGNYGYVFGGFSGGAEYADVVQYDPSGDAWTTKSQMPEAGMREPAAFVVDTIAYIGLGVRSGGSSHLSHMYRYSPATDKWTKVADFPEGRRAAVGFSIDTLGYIFGGFDYGKTPDNSLYSYSPKTNKWTKRTSMPGSGRSYMACGVVGGAVYMAGGMLAGSTSLKEFYMYEAAADKWTELADFPGGERHAMGAIVIGDVVYFGGGIKGSAHYTDWWAYDTDAKSWSQISNIPTSKTYDNAYFSINGKGYIATGANNNKFLDTTFELTVTVNGIAVFDKGTPTIKISSVPGSRTVIVNSKQLGDMSLELFDLSGKRVFSSALKKDAESIQLDFPVLSQGVYSLLLVQGNQRWSAQVLLNN